MDMEMYNRMNSRSIQSNDIFRRLNSDASVMLAESCGRGMAVVSYISQAHDLIYNVLKTKNRMRLDASAQMLTAFNYICTAFECQLDMVTDWASGREIFGTLAKYAFGEQTTAVQDYILMQILLQIESFEYGNVSRSTLAYIIDLFGLYFLTYSDWREYLPEQCDFPMVWLENSKVPQLSILDGENDIFTTKSTQTA